MHDFIASFQHAVIDELLAKLAVVVRDYPNEAVVFSGGVSVNSYLRALAKSRLSMPLYFSSPRYCTDNAAMIAYVGRQYVKRGQTTPLAVAPQARAVL